MKIQTKLTQVSMLVMLLIMGGCGSSSSDETTELTVTDGTSETIEGEDAATVYSYAIADSAQSLCYDNNIELACPASSEDFYGQDGQTVNGSEQSYTTNVTDDGDITVTDNVTGIIWTQSPEMNNDGEITSDDKLSSSAAASYCEALDYAGQTDWQLPNVKQLYSLMNFQGTDPTSDDLTYLQPFIDWNYFAFAYGSTDNERIIDSQYATTSTFTNGEGTSMMFGVNFTDGRIKGYEEEFFNGDKTYFVMCMRGNTSYATNDFIDNGDHTITDNATNLMWAQSDSGADYDETTGTVTESAGFDYTKLDWTDADGNGLIIADDTDLAGAMLWQDAFAYVKAMNAANYLGYSDWRLPNIKELHSLVEYTEKLADTDYAVIDDVFNITTITDENGEADYGLYWSSTTHATDGAYSDDTELNTTYGNAASYVAFGKALGYDSDAGRWVDVHGAGAQRSDPKVWDGEDYSGGYGPQYDSVRIYNYVRLVRDVN
ncbi:Lcl C-terminal domain-containing protein [Shewanella sp.]|uniref:Lcl C-terminal domain-containing protein n=2 Tax=Shewanella sp. TaxID=50422 RepID=UPI0040484584